MTEDLLDRWRLAKDVYTIVRDTRPDWSCRIGIYGKWGEGKTSLLRFVETQARSEGLISFWVNPSEAEDTDSLWRVVLEAFIDALDQENILQDEVKSWRVRFLAQKTEPLDKLAELNQYAKALVGFGRAALKEWLKPDGEQVRKIREKLHAGKIVVFIDDLDRTKPAVVPSLLMGLRDLLDLPGFCFIVAFDDEVLSRTLAGVNTAWGDGKAFLDKVLDFSFTLPNPKADQRLELLKYHIRELCPWMDLKVVEQNADLLPETPRKLKALLRNLMTLGPHVKRHDETEIQWIDLFMGQLLRLEAPGFLDDFMTDGNESLVSVGAYLPRKQGGPSAEESFEAAVKKSGTVDPAQVPRLAKLLRIWSERRAFVGAKNLAYYAGFGSTHKNITHREHAQLMSGYRDSEDLNGLRAQLAAHAARFNSPETEVVEEFLRMAVEQRAEHLEAAADAEMESDTIAFLAQAHECLKLVAGVLKGPPSVLPLTPALGRTLVQSLAGQSFKWMHFNVPVYENTRREERQLLLELARKNAVSALDWLDFLFPWTDQTLYNSAPAHFSAAQLIDELTRILQDRITVEALESFDTEGAHLQFYGPKTRRATRYCFFESNSPLWQEPGRAKLLALLERAPHDRAVRQNASELLGCFSGNRAYSGFVGDPAELKQILLTPGIAKALWMAATAQRVHYRFQQRLIEVRRGVLNTGVDAEQLPIPEWLSERVKELEG